MLREKISEYNLLWVIPVNYLGYEAVHNVLKQYLHLYNMYLLTNMCYLYSFEGYAVAQWLGLYLQLLGVAMVAGVSFLAVLEHHFSTVDPGMAWHNFLFPLPQP